jgi:hypothetical protein
MRKRLIAALLSTVLAAEAAAHHPGSHARRQEDGTVALEASVVAGDACTRIGSVSAGPPPGVAGVAGLAAVTARLEREGSGACPDTASLLKSEVRVSLPARERQIILYILAPDGTLVGSERVPVR